MRELSFALIVVALFAALVFAAPRKHDCSPAFLRALDDAVNTLTSNGFERQGNALDVAATAECRGAEVVPHYRRHRKDTTHDAVVDALRAYGWTFYSTSQNQQAGGPDGFASRMGRTVACEMKSPRGALRPSQQAWRQTWQGEYAVLSTFEDVARLTADCAITPLSTSR